MFVFSNDTILGDGSVYNSPESIAFGPNFKSMYVTDADRGGPGGGMHVLDPTTGAGTAFFPLPSSAGNDGAGESDWTALDANRNVFITNENTTQGVMQVNTTTGDVILPSFIPDTPGIFPYTLSFDKNGNVWLGDRTRCWNTAPCGASSNHHRPELQHDFCGDIQSGR